MMNRNFRYRSQKGVALILSLLLLFVLVLLGVAGFNSTHVQERSAANHRLQTVAFEAASAGANNAIDFYVTHRDDGDVPDQSCGATGHVGWEDPDGWIRTEPVDRDFDISGLGAATVTLSQRMYCLNDVYYCSADEEAAMGCIPGERPQRSQLFVQSRGEVNLDGKVVARRDVEVRLEVGQNGGGVGDGCGAMCFPGCDIGELDFGPSNSFTVDGVDGPAITTDNSVGCTTQQQILAEIKDKRLKNYEGGIVATGPHSPWDSVTDVGALRLAMRDSALLAEANSSCQIGCYLEAPEGGNYEKSGNYQFGTGDDPQITYIEGNAELGGGVSGAGILIVNGNLYWNGTPQWEGLMVVLGGTFEFGGGGQGGNWAGSVVVLNTIDASEDEFGETNFVFTGGGNANYTYNCQTLKDARDLLNGDGQNLWNPECNAGPANPYQAGPPELIIASWRENIGWRETFFDSD